MLLNCSVGEDSWRVPWTAKRSNQSILKEINPEYSLEGLMLKLLWPPDVNWLIRKDPDAGKDWRQKKGKTGWDGWMVSLTWWTSVWVSSGSWWWTGKPGVLQFVGIQRVRYDWATELSLAVAHELFLSFGMWDMVPTPGIEPSLLHRECGVLATGPPEKSLSPFLDARPQFWLWSLELILTVSNSSRAT